MYSKECHCAAIYYIPEKLWWVTAHTNTTVITGIKLISFFILYMWSVLQIFNLMIRSDWIILLELELCKGCISLLMLSCPHAFFNLAISDVVINASNGFWYLLLFSLMFVLFSVSPWFVFGAGWGLVQVWFECLVQSFKVRPPDCAALEQCVGFERF